MPVTVKTLNINGLRIGGNNRVVLIAGPCVIESETLTMRIAGQLKSITSELGIELIFKASYDKANRTSINSFRGPGLKKGLEILSKVKTTYNLPILSDVHSTEQIGPAAQVLDIIQIPTAAAAFASISIYSFCPPETPPAADGNCTLCVASNTTG